MVYDLDMIKACTQLCRAGLQGAQGCWQASHTLGKNSLLHLHSSQDFQAFGRGKSYVDFSPTRGDARCDRPDGVASVYVGGHTESIVPSTVHCDHLILAKEGAVKD